MSTGIIIHPDVQDKDLVLKSLIPSVQILNPDFNPSGLMRLGLMFHNELQCRIPFFKDVRKPAEKLVIDKSSDYRKIISENKIINAQLRFYSSSLVDLLSKLVIQNGSFILTLISCSMNSDEFLEETKIVQSLTGAKIEYSLNQTGTSIKEPADWILESNKENLIGSFFTESILTWTHTLFYNHNNTVFRTHSDIINYFDTAGGAGTLTYSHGKFRLHNDVTVDPYDTLHSKHIHVMLNDDEIFDGSNHTMTYTKTSSNTRGLFIFNSKPGSEASIRNLNITSINNALIYNGGSLVRGQQSNFIVKNCHNLSMNNTNDNCGGLIGPRCNNFKIVNCTNSAYLDGIECGGITGPNCTSFTIKNCKNLSNDGNFIEILGGGIVGAFCADFSISHCYNNVPINGTEAGGITGTQCYNFKIKDCKNDGPLIGILQSGIIATQCYKFKVKNCTNNQQLGNIYQSGIVGSQCYNFKVKHCNNNGDMYINSGGIVGPICSTFKIKNCKNTGDMLDTCGGIVATNCSNLVVKNCKNYGNILSGSGGIVGSGTGNNAIYSANLYVKIRNCTNYGQISGPDAGGIAGSDFGYVNGSNSNTTNVKLEIYNCVNKGYIDDTATDAGGLCGSHLGLTSYPNGESATIKILNCSTRYGNLIGGNTLFNTSFSVGNNIATPSRLIISNSSTSKKVSLITGFSATATDPENTCSAVYIKSNGEKVNLLRHQSFVSRSK